jgi:hypothetical protein
VLGLVLKFAVINPIMNHALTQEQLPIIKSFTTPEALQVALRRQVAVTEDDFIQGRYSIFDSHRDITYISIPRMTELLDPYRSEIKVQKLIDKSE